MAANFWTSSQFKQLLEQEEVDVVHPLDKERGVTVEDFKLIKLHTANYIWKLAQNVTVRQRVIATAVTYMRRVYTKKSMTELDPRLVGPTCLYLATKAEECTVQARVLVVFHPYRPLSQGLINDTYKMDLILIYPPHLIALACIYIASVLKDKDTTSWFEELRVDMNVVKNISMEILDFYDNPKNITDEKIALALNKLNKV